MKAAKRIGIEVVGWVLVLAGIAALVLPGPGLLLLFAGLAVLSQQYDWADRRLAPIKYRALKGAAESVETALRLTLSGVAVVLLVAAGVLWWVQPPVPTWWFLPDWLWLPGGKGTAITQGASAAIAVATLVYSYRRFHGKPEAVAELDREIEEADEEFHRG